MKNADLKVRETQIINQITQIKQIKPSKKILYSHSINGSKNDKKTLKGLRGYE